MADDSDHSEEMSDSREYEDEPVLPQLPITDDLKEGERRFQASNRFIEAYFDKKNNQWVYPWHSSKKYPIGQNVEGNIDDFLSGTEIALLAKRFNEFGKNASGTSIYLKMKGREIPTSYIRFLSQSPSVREGKMVLLIVKAHKQLAKRLGQEVDICTIFEVLPTGGILAPEGLVHSRQAFRTTDAIPLVFSDVIGLNQQQMNCIQIFKHMAAEFQARPSTEVTPEQHFQIFCLFCSLRSSDTKFANHMMEMSGYATGKTKKGGNEFTIMGGSYNLLRESWLTLLYTHGANITLEESNPANRMFKKKYEATFKLKTKRQSNKKRKHEAEREDMEEPRGYCVGDEDREFLTIDLAARPAVNFGNKWVELVSQHAKIPKNEEELWEYFEEKTVGSSDAKKQELREKAQAYQKSGDSEEEAKAKALREMQNDLKKDFRIRLVPTDGGKEVVNPMVEWSNESVDPAREVLKDMIRAALVMTSAKMVIQTEKITDETKSEYLSRFFLPKNKKRILAIDKDAQSITNIILLEHAMDMVIQSVLSNQWNGKNIAMVIAIQCRDMFMVIENLMENDYTMLQKWVGERILEIPMEGQDDQQATEFNNYYLPSILSAMVLYITRKFHMHCEQHGWFKLPECVNIPEGVQVIPLKIPCKVDDLATMNFYLDDLKTIAETAGHAYDFSQISMDDHLDNMQNNMIISRRTDIFVPHMMGPNFPYLHIQLCKTVDGRGNFKDVVVKPKFTFSIYPIFFECDPVHCTDQIDGLENALSPHRVISHIHDGIRQLWSNIKSQRPKAYDQVPVWQYLKGTEHDKNQEWINLQEPMDDDMARKNVKNLDDFSVSAIDSVLADIAVTVYMIVGKVIDHPEFDLPLFPNNTLKGWNDKNNRLSEDQLTLDRTTSKLKTFFIDTGKLVSEYAKQAGKRTPVGVSIVDDTLRGMVYIGSLNTFDLVKGNKDAFVNLAQIAPLCNVFFRELNVIDPKTQNDRFQGMCSEHIIINPLVYGIENMEPMSNAAWAKTEQVLANVAAQEEEEAGGA